MNFLHSVGLQKKAEGGIDSGSHEQTVHSIWFTIFSAIMVKVTNAEKGLDLAFSVKICVLLKFGTFSVGFVFGLRRHCSVNSTRADSRPISRSLPNSVPDS